MLEAVEDGTITTAMAMPGPMKPPGVVHQGGISTIKGRRIRAMILRVITIIAIGRNTEAADNHPPAAITTTEDTVIIATVMEDIIIPGRTFIIIITMRTIREITGDTIAIMTTIVADITTGEDHPPCIAIIPTRGDRIATTTTGGAANNPVVAADRTITRTNADRTIAGITTTILAILVILAGVVVEREVVGATACRIHVRTITTGGTNSMEIIAIATTEACILEAEPHPTKRGKWRGGEKGWRIRQQRGAPRCWFDPSRKVSKGHRRRVEFPGRVLLKGLSIDPCFNRTRRAMIPRRCCCFEVMIVAVWTKQVAKDLWPCLLKQLRWQTSLKLHLRYHPLQQSLN
mmetsp:Transcript_7463/g.16139  ORF Transcript_7463/g.16139 Transcript_7463/m.16139 type:complete len:346 (-) Transcript_7463:620-1657(-)